MTRPSRDQLRFFGGLVLRLAALILLIWLAGKLGLWVKVHLDFEVSAENETALRHAILMAALAYILLTALPFVPGAEVGMAMLSMFGASVAPLVYGATVAALMLAFCIGHLIPARVTAALLARIGLRKAAGLVAQTGHLPQPERLAYLMQKSGSKQVLALTRYRYVALALMINMPGNIVFGGGGGLAMLAGLSGVFAPLPFLLTVLVAVLPVPLAVLLMGH